MRMALDLTRLLFMFFIGSTILYFIFAGIILTFGIEPFDYSHTVILVIVMLYEFNRLWKKKNGLDEK